LISSGVTPPTFAEARARDKRYDAWDLASSSRAGLGLLLALATCGAAYGLACGDSGDASGFGNSGDDGGPSSLPDAAVGSADAGAPTATMRLAHLAADLGPIDLCYRTANASSFEGPVLGGGLGAPKRDAGASDGGGDASGAGADPLDGATLDAAGALDGSADAGAAAIDFRTVSRYLTLDAAGPLTIALVAPGSTSCTTPLLLDDVTLDPGKLATVAIVGRRGDDGGAGSLGLVAFIDDRTVAPSTARVRMINAALGAAGADAAPDAPNALAVRAVGAQTITLAEHVEPRRAGSPSSNVPVDSLGYATVAPVPSPARLAVGAAADTKSDAAVDSWVSEAGELGLVGSSLHTGFVLTGSVGPYEILWCTDTSTSGDLTTCSLVR
jgi:hypothetical protein